jgi:DUF1365 family protein
MHHRRRPRVHKFRYRVFWLLLDLDELPLLDGRLRLFSLDRPNLFAHYARDHGDGSDVPLRGQIDALLAGAGIDLGGGAVRLLCMPRMLGYVFNPLSVYYCYRADGGLAALVHEVHNTFGERHAYVIPVAASDGAIRQDCRKAFYVSPFMDMDLRYAFRVAPPAERVTLAIRASDGAGPVLDACLTGARHGLSDRTLLAVLAAMPFVTVKVIVAIHWEAARLWLKGLRPRWRTAARPGAAPSGA